jgi:uncharacterized protein YjbI with pentapeptide repeats
MKPKLTTRILKYLLITSAAIMVAYALIWITLQAYSAPWTGFGDFTKPTPDFIRGKTLWEWMQLFIIPIFLSFGVFLLNRSERNNESKIASDRQREAALQTYLDRMSDLLLKEKLRSTENEEVRNIARTRTLTLLRELDPRRKRIVLLFLLESGLITNENNSNNKNKFFRINLTEADLSGADLFEVFLIGIHLAGANMREANLSNATLMDAFLQATKLNKASLTKAILIGAIMFGADLTEANLSGANLNRAKLTGANLNRARLIGANLTGADLGGTDLTGADLTGADLTGANLGPSENSAYISRAPASAIVTNKQLAKVKSLKGTIMPDGTKHD